MSRRRSWTDEELIVAVKKGRSYRSVLIALNLIPAGGNYQHVKESIQRLGLDISHFTGKGWNRRWIFDPRKPAKTLEEILINGKLFQSHKLRLKLIAEGIKKPQCELCGWKKLSKDGRLPLELDHINGDHLDNRLENLRILCPNCHSLQPTHRGKNRKLGLRAGVVTGSQG